MSIPYQDPEEYRGIDDEVVDVGDVDVDRERNCRRENRDEMKKLRERSVRRCNFLCLEVLGKLFS